MKKLTIFTPTYNREYVLTNAYKSLLEQDSNDFVWLIVDDGSTDNTESLVKEWIDENRIDIKYYKKANGGKHSAYNFAVDKIDTPYFLLALDSDDKMANNSVKYIIDELEKEENREYYGLVTLKDITGYKNVKYNLDKLQGKSLAECLANDILAASLIFIFKSEYIKKFKFPIIEGEKFFTEAYLYYQMEAPLLWSNRITENATFMNDGLTKNTKSLFVKYPKSWFIYNKLRFTKTKKFKLKIKFMIYYISFGLLANEKHIIKNSPNKFWCSVLFPLGFLGKFYLKRN